MDLQRRVVTPISKPAATGACELQPGLLIEALVLFEQVIIDSNRLRDIGGLIRCFGYQGVRQLLDDGSVQILCDVATVAQTGQTVLRSRPVDRLLPPNSFSFSTVHAADRRDYIQGCFKELAESAELEGQKLFKLKELVARRLRSYDRVDVRAAVSQLENDLIQRHPGVRQAIAFGLQSISGLSVEWERLNVDVDQLSERDYRVASNLGEITGLSDQSVHQATQRGLLASGGFNLRLEGMREFEAVTFLKTDELPFLDSRLSRLARIIDPEDEVTRLRRVLEITNFPDFSAIKPGDVSLERLLDVRRGEACTSFRKWLQESSALTLDEIESQFSPVRDSLSRLARGTPGKLVRWAASTGVGAIPGVGSLLGAGLGLLDSFLIDRLLPKPSPLSFLGNELRSVFPD